MSFGTDQDLRYDVRTLVNFCSFYVEWSTGRCSKNLFDERGSINLDLADLIHDAGRSYLRLNIFLNPASYTLGKLFNLNSSPNHGLLLPKTSLSQSNTSRTGLAFRRSVSAIR
jgi:hypothetical protein